MKREFKFYMPDGSTGTVADIPSLEESERLLRESHLEAHLFSEIYYERKWRNEELILTDKLMFSDSTYDGTKIIGSICETEICLYRNKLREYDLQYQDRPTRPDWFKG